MFSENCERKKIFTTAANDIDRFKGGDDWVAASGVGANLKVGGTGPDQKWLGAPIRREAPEKKNIFGSCLSTFFGSKSTIRRFGERSRDGHSTVWSVSCLLFFYSRWPRAQPFVKVGGHVPPCPMESAPLVAAPSL